MRTAILGGVPPLVGLRSLYISMMNAATMEENKLFCKVIVGDHDMNAESVMRVAAHQENHRISTAL